MAHQAPREDGRAAQRNRRALRFAAVIAGAILLVIETGLIWLVTH